MAASAVRLTAIAFRICDDLVPGEPGPSTGLGDGWLAEPKLVRGEQARLRVALRRYGAASFACIHERRMVAQIYPRWNRLQPWFELVGGFKDAAQSARSTIYTVLA